MNPVIEHIPLGIEKSIFAFCYEATSFETPWHVHPQHELTYIEKSVGTKFIGDYVGPYEPGELVLLRSNLPHCWRNFVKEGIVSKSYVVQWNKGIFASVPETQAIFDMLKTASQGLIFDQDAVRFIIPELRKLPALDGANLYIAFLRILLKLTDCSYSTLSESQSLDDLPQGFGSRLAKIHEYVGKNYDQKIYLRDVAALVNMTEQSFSRFFTKMMGRSFFAFLNEYRINMAGRMLLDTDWSVSEIGFRCGYDSLPFFYKQFKKYKLDSPLSFRKQHGKLHL